MHDARIIEINIIRTCAWLYVVFVLIGARQDCRYKVEKGLNIVERRIRRTYFTRQNKYRKR